MVKRKFSQIWIVLIGIFILSLPLLSQGIIVDHTCTDITKIPDSWINQARSMLKIHYAHTSHGEQITVGLERLSNSNAKYHFYPDNCTVPQDSNYLCLMDGQYFDSYCETYITPELYWEGGDGMNITRSVLNRFSVNVSLWAWCTQLDYYSQGDVQVYLNNMAQLESEYPNITFIYMTGNAQSQEQNRYQRNNQIREYCRNNNKILFDFADLDCWYNGQQNTEGGIPMEHPHYNGDEVAHTTYQSCENKGRAFWWLLARIAGWDGSGGGTTPTPLINIDQTSLSFTGAVNGAFPTEQNFTISNTGSGTLNWTVSDNVDWLTCTPTSGTDSGIVTVYVDQTGLGIGNHSAVITVSDTNAGNSPQTIDVLLNLYESGIDYPPFGSFDSPMDNVTVQSSIPVTGWALDESGIDHIKIYRESGGSLVYIGDALQVEGARPDIETAYPGYPNNSKAGWGYMMLTNFLPNGGNGTYTLHAIVTDLSGHQVTLGTKTITCDNANAVKPFGAIDTPTQGGTATGNSFINWGWVLTPQPNKIPVDGSTINVYVDGVRLGHPKYNIYRADIASFFPGYANSSGAAGYFTLDTTKYGNEVHTIQWTATDNGGNTDGIGSRYFRIQNSAQKTSSQLKRKDNSNGTTGLPGVTEFNKNSLVLTQILANSRTITRQPVAIKKGFNKNSQAQLIAPDESGLISIKSGELNRLKIYLNGEDTPSNVDNTNDRLGSLQSQNYSGFLAIGNRLRPLPVGSTLDVEKGIFYWQPGPGFLGNFELLFIKSEQENKKSIQRIIISIMSGGE